jgi:hypothetical protein
MVENIIAARGLGPQMGVCDKKKESKSDPVLVERQIRS